MIEAKIILLMFVWPAGQAAERPFWTSDAFLTVESCQADAARRSTLLTQQYGADVRIEYQCVHIDDRIAP